MMERLVIDARRMHYREINRRIKEAVARGVEEIRLVNVNGQRYIGGGVKGKTRIIVEGVPGNDLAAFMDGPTIIVKSNAQDCVCNTMNDGQVIVHGDAGDVLGYGMRGGRLYVKGSIGYRVGIHMKAYQDKKPILIVGGSAGDFLGEYMAGGILVVLGLEGHQPPAGNFIATGIHGGVIYIRGMVERHQVAREAAVENPTSMDEKTLEACLKDYCNHFNLSLDEILGGKFTKIVPTTHRPYGQLYAY